MHPAIEPASTPPPSWAQRLFGRWWRSQSAARQDRFATLGPLVSVLLFLAAIVRASPEDPSLPTAGPKTASEAAFVAARNTPLPTFSRPFLDVDGTAVFQVHIPLISHTNFAGTLVAEYSIEALLRHAVPEEVTKRRAIEVLDEHEELLA